MKEYPRIILVCVIAILGLILMICQTPAGAQNMDFGDAPDPYPTKLSDSGPRHNIVTDVYLGICVDGESDGQPSEFSKSDDENSGSPGFGCTSANYNDEDGIVFTSILAHNRTAKVRVTANAACTLSAWIDFNWDGDWNDEGEDIFPGGITINAGMNNLTFQVPELNLPNTIGLTTKTELDHTKRSFGLSSRFRCSTEGALSPIGPASNGEVEDHDLEVGYNGGYLVPPITINEFHANTFNREVEFIELYDGGTGNFDLSGLVLAVFKGGGSITYMAHYDLDGHSTDQNGYFVICRAGSSVNNCNLFVEPPRSAWSILWKGPAGFGLYMIDNFDPDQYDAYTTVSGSRLIHSLVDAVAYPPDHQNSLKNAFILDGQPALFECASADCIDESNQRCPNGSGGRFNTDTFAQFISTPGEANLCTRPDLSPTIVSTNPQDGSNDVLPNGDIIIEFSENVSVRDDWFDINCHQSGPKTATASGGPKSYTIKINSGEDFVDSEGCTVTLIADMIEDQDGAPNKLEGNLSFRFKIKLAAIESETPPPQLSPPTNLRQVK